MSTRRPRKVSQSITGAVSAPSTVKGVISPSPQVDCPAAPRRQPGNGVSVARQTHGAVTPLTGPVTSVSQLINGGVNVAKGSAGSFETLGEYTAYLRKLSLADLHRHAVEDARIVPIDDRDRLIRRLETEWTATAAKYPGRLGQTIPQRKPFTAEQIAKQDEIRRNLLKGVA